MQITIDSTDTRPIYEQIADGIRTLIASGQLAEGQPLPPVRQMAADLGVNFNTIAAAYRELHEEGLITVKHGSRAIVAARTATRPNSGDLRPPLRQALTKMVLAGLRRSDIMNMVNDELRGLAKGVKP